MDKRIDLRRSALGLALVMWVTLSGVVAASGAQQEGYPPAAVETPAAATPLAYPSASPADLLPLPIGGEPAGDPTEGVVGGGSGLAVDAASPVAQAVSDQGLLFLWLGFIATLLIFITCVIGSATLFTRRNEP